LNQAISSRLADIAIAAASFLLFVGAYEVNSQTDRLLLYAPGVNLIFIPAGIKLFCLLVAGVPAAIGLFIASIFLTANSWAELKDPYAYIIAVISIGSYATAIYSVKRVFNIGSHLGNLKWWHIIALSAMAAVLNGVAHHVIYVAYEKAQSEGYWSGSAAMAFGDFLGCFFIVMLFSLSIQLARKFSNERSTPDSLSN
jgi:hypothetical protein